MSGADTRETILDAAERLFAEQGYAATSLRQLTTLAEVNLAAVNYHFGGKEELTKAVLARRIEPINRERLRQLDAACEAGPRVETVLRAFVEPPLRGACALGQAEAACRMFSRIMTEQPAFLRAFLAAQFGDVVRRFTAALRAASPDLDVATVSWRLHFAVGAMAHVVQNAPTISHMTDGRCDPTHTDVLLEQLVAFLAGGFGARRPGRPRAGTGRRTKAGGKKAAAHGPRGRA